MIITLSNYLKQIKKIGKHYQVKLMTWQNRIKLMFKNLIILQINIHKIKNLNNNN
jgi:hypothetical protein